ncbi:MAG TPA: hypothetical protein VMR54_00870 [Thermoanaerobaculia bacterium]|nr:hypothetical protein [Thermoanaerobaculia bacterium]
MNWKLMFKGDYLAAIEFGTKVFNAEIKEVRLCKLEGEDGRQKDKGVVFFKGQDKGWVLCKTNAMCLAAMFGQDTTEWVGKRVTLFAKMVQVGKQMQPGIRVKGSPSLTEPMDVEIKLPRKKPFKMRMEVTGRANGKQTTPPPETAPDDGDSGPPDDSEPTTDEQPGEIQF